MDTSVHCPNSPFKTERKKKRERKEIVCEWTMYGPKFSNGGNASINQPMLELSLGLHILISPSTTILLFVLLGPGAQPLSVTGRMQRFQNFWVSTVLDYGPFSVSALKFGSFLAPAAAKALRICLLVKLIFITCDGAQILWYWPWPCRWYNRQKNAEWNLKGLRGLQSRKSLKVLRKGKLELVPQKCEQALTFHPLLWLL